MKTFCKKQTANTLVPSRLLSVKTFDEEIVSVDEERGSGQN